MRPPAGRAARWLLVEPLQRIARWLLSLMLGSVILISLWHIVSAGEQGAMESTAKHLASSLNALAAENMAQGRALDTGWVARNPFVLLRWQPDNYCGELVDGLTPERGCWYFLAQRSQVLYRARFDWRGNGSVRVWQLVRLPQQITHTVKNGRPSAVELRAVEWREP